METQRACAAIVVAAGASRRLGLPKQLAMLGTETLLERAVRTAREAGCAPVVVVLGAAAAEIRERCALGDAVIVVHAEWASGMGSSIRCGVGALDEIAALGEGALLGEVAGCVVMTCDMPGVTPAHLRALRAGQVVTASGYAGRRGVPAYFPRSLFTELALLDGDAGARELLSSAPVVELPGGECDVDTAEELAHARDRFDPEFRRDAGRAADQCGL